LSAANGVGEGEHGHAQWCVLSDSTGRISQLGDGTTVVAVGELLFGLGDVLGDPVGLCRRELACAQKLVEIGPHDVSAARNRKSSNWPQHVESDQQVEISRMRAMLAELADAG
jgi:hypothetical protein